MVKGETCNVRMRRKFLDKLEIEDMLSPKFVKLVLGVILYVKYSSGSLTFYVRVSVDFVFEVI